MIRDTRNPKLGDDTRTYTLKKGNHNLEVENHKPDTIDVASINRQLEAGHTKQYVDTDKERSATEPIQYIG